MFMNNFEFKEKYSINDLEEILKILRSPSGCPWDKEQTHKSIRADFIEETYEAIEAIDTDNPVLLREELGDVLLQVMFHAQIEDEQGNFSFSDVVNDISQKLIRRHPHVFGEITADTPDEVLKNWDAIKRREKSQETLTDALNSVSKSLPALMRAQNVIKRANRQAKAAGMDSLNDFILNDENLPIDKIQNLAISYKNMNNIKNIGEIILECVKISEILKKNCETLLTDATEQYIIYFRQSEENNSGCD
jgi:tetrapyrrole methylase family protein/MazG family protein